MVIQGASVSRVVIVPTGVRFAIFRRIRENFLLTIRNFWSIFNLNVEQTYTSLFLLGLPLYYTF